MVNILLLFALLQQQPADSLAARARIVPVADYHQHLAGPTAITMQELDPPLPEVTLPAELARVLELRGRLSGVEGEDPRFADLYTEDPQILDITDPPWLAWRRSRDDARAMAGAFTPGSRFMANQYFMGDSVAFAAGVLRDSAGTAIQAYFSMAFQRGRDGRWRIAMEQEEDQRRLPFASPITADRIIQVLDDAGIKRATILSTAYWLGSRPLVGASDSEYAKVRAENDWTLQQVSRYPERLVPFCSVNPLRDYAIRELTRCADIPAVRGMKLHLGNSHVNLTNHEHVARLRDFFRAANARRLAIVVHLWNGPSYGPQDARIFLDSILAAAPDIPVQIAHLAGGGRFGSEPALAVFVDAITAGDARVRNVWFDVATDVSDTTSAATRARIATRLRQIGLRRILFGSDTPIPGRDIPVTTWAMVRRLPLTNAELRIVASNVPPYMTARVPSGR